MKNCRIETWMRRALPVFLLLLFCGSSAQAADLTGTYTWKPVAVGAGGFVTGFVTHPLNANVRYCRTDVGNAYRWDTTAGMWMPMVVRNPDGSGVPASATGAPGGLGVQSIAVDPSNVNTVYMSFPVNISPDAGAAVPNTLYKSTDGGHNFTACGLTPAGDPNGNFRNDGERMMVDPNNGNVVYYGTETAGIWRSVNGGTTFTQVTGGGAPSATANVINIQFYKGGGTISAFGITVSKVVYASVPQGDIYKSADGGQTWTDISTGTAIAGNALQTTMDANGMLWVSYYGSFSFWKYSAAGVWSQTTGVPYGMGGVMQNVAVDPNNTNRIFITSPGGGLARSLDGGATYTVIENNFMFGNTLGWLPEPFAGYRSNGGLFFDKNGVLWCPEGNEGMLTFTPSADDHEDATHPALWTIASQGINELVTHDVIIPQGLGDKAFIACEDMTGVVIPNPDTFTTSWVNLQPCELSNCESASWCPNASSYIAYLTNDAYQGCGNPSGYSADGGTTWTKFATPPGAFGGSIAISRRGAWGLGSDHICILPSNGFDAPDYGVPVYTKDGGQTWSKCTTFTSTGGGYSGFYLKQRQLRADPFVPDKFYCKPSFGSFSVSTDGGANWTSPSNALPAATINGDLEVNFNVQNDLWYADGFGGSNTHGVWHSTDDGVNWTQIPLFTHAITLTLGKGDGGTGHPNYAAYVYGCASDNVYGIFRSVDGGGTWDRISYYPFGIFDEPTALASSWDTFGLVYCTMGGETAVYGKLTGVTVPPAPTGLTATPGNAQVALSWSASSGATSYNVKRSTVNGSGYVTVSSPTTTSFTNTGLANGTTYYYVVTAVNSAGESGNSNQVSATPFGPPPAPTGLTATPGNAQVALNWAASSGATSYNALRSTVSGSGYASVVTGVAVTSYTNTGLTNGTTYYYVVRAVNASGTSGNSNEVPARPAAPQPTAQISMATTAPVIDGNVDAIWSSATSYSLSNLIGTLPGGATLTATWKGLWDSTNLYVLVTVTDSTLIANSDPTAGDSVELYIDGDNNKSATYDANDWQYVFPWNSATVWEFSRGVQGSNTTGVTFGQVNISGGYRIEAKIPWSTIGVTAAANNLVGLDFAINDSNVLGTRACKMFWNSPADNDWTNPSLFGAGNLNATPPAAPTGLTATPGNTQVALSWTASTGATSYNVLRSTVSGSGYVSAATGITATNYYNTGLTNGTTYYFVATATNSGGTSGNSSQASAKPAAAPQGQIAHATTAPVIDGNIDSIWSSATSYPLSNLIGTLPSGANLTATWKGLWDSSNLYLLVTVMDSTLIANTDPTQGDSVEVYIDGDNNKSATYDANDWQYVFPWNSATIWEFSSGVQGTHTAGITFAQVNITGGYRIEAKIPWSTIGVTAVKNNLVGLDFAIDDSNVVGTRACKIYWNAIADNDWTNPSLFGTGKLN